MKTKLFSLFLALVASVGSIYADSVKIGDFYYDLDAGDKTARVTGHSSIWGDISIPASVIYNGDTYCVTSIGDKAFSWFVDLTSITIPNSVTSIGQRAFAECHSLNSINIPNSVTSIGNEAFYHCDDLTSITIPNSVTSIGENVFYYCHSLPVFNNIRYADTYLVEAVDETLSSYTIKEGTKWIGYFAFYGCSNLTSITIPNSVTSIEYFAFQGCTSLTSITIPNSVTNIGLLAFGNCTSLTSLTIPNSVTSIGQNAFFYCLSLTSIGVSTNNPNYSSQDGVLFDKGKTTLIQYPGGKRDAYIIPNSVTSIGNEAFSYCTGLTSVTIPNSVENINERAFAGCSSLTSVTCYATTPPSLVKKVFDGVDCSQIPLYVPQESIDTYKAADQWKEFNPILPIQNPEGVDNVNSSVKQNTSKLIRDGKVYILRGDQTYTLTGQDVK